MLNYVHEFTSILLDLSGSLPTRKRTQLLNKTLHTFDALSSMQRAKEKV